MTQSKSALVDGEDFEELCFADFAVAVAIEARDEEREVALIRAHLLAKIHDDCRAMKEH